MKSVNPIFEFPEWYLDFHHLCATRSHSELTCDHISQIGRSRTKVCRDVGTPFLDLQKTITKAVLLQIEAILGIQHASNLSQRIPMALAVTNLPGFEFYDVLKLNTPNPGYLILTPKIPISTSKPYHTEICFDFF